ncbi:MAG: protein kinase [Pirellulales bacterium]|nr:protein kinase [Pirellulales bacterium]
MGATNSSTRITGSASKPASDSARTPIPLSPTPKPMPIVGDRPTVISSRPPLPTPSASDSAHRILEGRIRPGDFLGHFELLDYVGGGGMGRVFRASDTRLARIVALKVLSLEQAADAETVQRFQNEAQSAARLDHENIARVHYVGEDRGIHFIAFEFVEGVNVRVLLEQRGPLPLDEALSYTLQIAEALSHADARDVVHRDIKPSNVIVTPEGRAKLIDMGLARLRQLDSTAADLTASGVTLGTFDYISPEQARDPRNADTRSDIYSLGCTLFFMLTGRPPFVEGTVLQKLLQHQTEQPPDVREFRADLPEEIAPVLAKMLAKDPRNRYRDAGELARDLLAVSERLGLQPPLPGNRSWPAGIEAEPRFMRRHIPWMASLAALLAIVLGLEIYGTIATPPADSRSPPNLVTEDYLTELPLPKKPPATQTREKSPGQTKLPKKPVLENAESDLPAPSAGREKRADIPFAADFRGGAAFPANPAGDSSLPLVTGTAEPYFRGKNLETGQSFAAPLMIAPPKGAFPLDFVDNSPSPWRFSPSSIVSPANPAGLPAKFRLDAASAASAAKRNGKLIVGDAGGAHEFSTLGAACAAARNGDIIELRYNGRREEQPLVLQNLRITIRAGEGYAPVLVFRPREPDPITCPRGIFTLRSGRLSLTNLAVELIVPRDVPAETWSLFEIHGGQTVRIERSALTIVNADDEGGAAGHADTAFFRVLSASETHFADEVAPSEVAAAATLELFDVFARGEAVFLRAGDLQPVNLSWENGLLIAGESLLYATGGTREPKAGEMLHLNLRHVTAIARDGLFRWAGSPAAPFQLPTLLNCADNIFVSPLGMPLIQQEAAGALDNPRRLITWNGDLNFYDSIEVFWTLRPSTGETSPDAMDFAGWLSHWGPSRENQSMLDRVHWKRLPGSERPAHRQTPNDYALDREQIENPALGAASDGSDAGVQAGRLLSLPEP